MGFWEGQRVWADGIGVLVILRGLLGSDKTVLTVQIMRPVVDRHWFLGS